MLMLAGCGRAGQVARAAHTGNGTSPAAQSASAPSPAGLAALAGTWQVTAVHVDPEGEQALSENDPADMGAVLDVTEDRLAWRPRKAGTFIDRCTGASLGADGQVSCRDGQFGPPGAHLTRAGGTLRLDWYDGATLMLRRDG